MWKQYFCKGYLFPDDERDKKAAFVSLWDKTIK